MINHFLSVARRKANNADPTWAIARLEALGPDTLVTCAPTTVFQSGKRKGQRKYLTPSTQICVTKSEIDGEEQRFETETGQCHRCYGHGKIVAAVSVASGTIYRSCPRCKSSGLRPEPLDKKDKV